MNCNQTKGHKGTITTFTRREVDLFNTRVEDIDIRDIAHALSNICRFTGHGKYFYSVAEHCFRVSQVLSPALAFYGLLHDAAEAYLNDISSPLKHSEGMEAYCKHDERITNLIFQRFDLPLLSREGHEVIKAADTVVYMREYNVLFNNGADFVPMSPRVAKAVFLQHFCTLRLTT